MKTILFSILILFSINGFAFNWKKVGDSVNGNSYYVDVDNIKKHNGLVYYWSLVSLDDYLQPLDGGIYSVINKYKTDCGEEKHTRLNVTTYSQSMGRGKIITEDSLNEIHYVKPKTFAHIVMKFVCDRAE